ncbi:hypothetical protein C9374_002572 [Naegleria lovaniensis]|uniref:Phosphatidylinositol-4-phosphate 5-kinase n=1 Tax=Naegleria lovaniensis TaxID=51637 RepID=A0AA88KM65_NAELO|nr:uncharacterized protein C9374_002572 [Naegleria lovaniensis]KAG2386126.1 hypothetical protein C9374_002572 [Naegleria lovaniensis]
MSNHQVRESLSFALKFEDEKHYVEAFAQYLCCIDLITSQLRELTIPMNISHVDLYSQDVQLKTDQLFYFARECLYRSEIIFNDKRSYFGGGSDSGKVLTDHSKDLNHHEKESIPSWLYNPNVHPSSNIYPSISSSTNQNYGNIGNGGGLLLGEGFDKTEQKYQKFDNNKTISTMQPVVTKPSSEINTQNSNKTTTPLNKSIIQPKQLETVNVNTRNSSPRRTPPPLKKSSSISSPSDLKSSAAAASSSATTGNSNTSPNNASSKAPPKLPSKLSAKNSEMTSSKLSSQSDNIQQEPPMTSLSDQQQTLENLTFVKQQIAYYDAINKNLENSNNTAIRKTNSFSAAISSSRQSLSFSETIPNSNTLMTSSSSLPETTTDKDNINTTSVATPRPFVNRSQRSSEDLSSSNSHASNPRLSLRLTTTTAKDLFTSPRGTAKPSSSEHRRSLSQRMISSINKRDLTNKFSEEEHKYLTFVFHIIDSQSKDSYLDLCEFTQHLSLLAFDRTFMFDFNAPYPTIKKSKIQPTFAGRLFNALDLNKSGSIEIFDFKESASTLYSNVGVEEQAKLGFNIFDRDNDGIATKQDFITVFQQIFSTLDFIGLYKNATTDGSNSPSSFLLVGHSEILSHAVTIAEKIFSSIDQTNNGSITVAEYCKAVKENPFLILGFSQIPINDSLKLKLTRNLSRNGGQPVFFGHPSFHKVLSMMIGIRLSQEIRPSISGPYLTDRDFKFMNTFELTPPKFLRCIQPPIHYNLDDPNTKYIDEQTTFTDCAPLVFKNIRALFGVSEEEYALSFGPEMLFSNLLMGKLTTLSERLTDGKSGNFFFYTHNGRFLCKTISSAEFETTMEFLGNYYSYLYNNRETLLTKIYGLYKINDICFIVMGNVFDTQLPIDKIYDLKGSTIGRYNSTGVGILKDLNWKDTDKTMRIQDPLKKERLLKQIMDDTKFLERNEIIDYSLLVGIHETKKFREKPIHYQDPIYTTLPSSSFRTFYQEDYGGMLSTNQGEEIYFVAIIDILIQYGLKKRGENLIKTIYFGEESGISVVDPNMYAGRFLNFMKSIVE